MKKDIKDLTAKETIEDIIYHIHKLHHQVPSFCDERMVHIKELLGHLIEEIEKE